MVGLSEIPDGTISMSDVQMSAVKYSGSNKVLGLPYSVFE